MKKGLLKTALAAALALSLVVGYVPIQPVADVFGSMAVTAYATENDTIVTWDSDTISGPNGNDGINIAIRYTNGSPDGGNTSDSFTKDGITITADRTGDTSFTMLRCSVLQIENDGKFVFSTTSGTIKKIEITATFIYTDDANWTPDDTDTTLTWTGNSSVVSLTNTTIVDISEIKFTVDETAETYTVMYNANGGTGTVPVDTACYAQGDAVTVADSSGLSKEGCYFIGWATSSTATEPDYTAGQTFTMGDSDVTLYAVWSSVSDIIINPSDYGTVMATVGGTEVTSAAFGSTVTLNVSPENGYVLRSLIVKDADGYAVPVTNNTFTMPEYYVTINAEFRETGAISYIGADGQTMSVTDYTVLTGLEAPQNGTRTIVLPGGTYVVDKEDFEYLYGLVFTGDVKLILCDDCKMKISSGASSGACEGIYVKYGSIEIYSQSAGTGSLNITTNGGEHGILSDIDVCIYGGCLYIYGDTTGTSYIDPIAAYNNIMITGGNVTLKGYQPIYAHGLILSYSKPTDSMSFRAGCDHYIYATVVEGKALVDQFGNFYSGSFSYQTGFGSFSYQTGFDEKIFTPAYIVNIPETAGGTVTADREFIAGYDENRAVTLNVAPANGYILKSLIVTDASGKEITVTDNTFTMPDGNVTVSAEFEITDYNISITAPANGTVTAAVGEDANAETAHYGDTVILTAVPDEGYALKSFTVKDSNDNIVPVENDQFTMPADNVTVTAVFKRVFADGIGARLAGYSLSLDGDIGVKFYMELDPAVANSETAYMQFTLPNGKTSEVYVKEAETDTTTFPDKTYYVFKCNVAAKEMTADIKAQIIDGQKQGKEYTYTVKEYADYILKNAYEEDGTTVKNAEFEKAVPLVKAMLNYGAYSQEFFNYRKDDLANSSISDTDKDLSSVKAADLTSYAYNPDLTNLPDGVTCPSCSLTLESETALNLYFICPEDKEISFRLASDNHGTLTEIKENGRYKVSVKNISAENLDEQFTINITYDGVSTYSITYSPMTYCYNQIRDESNSEELRNVMRAFYLYNQAAKKVK